ncbi:hypothetical protein N7516_006760 [Penicillium verrucosum]|uniref:uncharacterized protein n=1 Tax=Penicillium verrucosum TaxID=60171 RepID=UPI002544E951|nr:uncharacterized protein N7516_006760 [Penicillium verrucosum]KAJ5932271.1 hypothetical protein N7516_006760 [Penicillium verrucosum]
MRPNLTTGHNEEQTPIDLAAKNGHIDVVRMLSDSGSPINAQDGNGATPLAFSAWNGHLDIVQFLLSRRTDPKIATEHAGTSLCMASHSGNIDVAVLLCVAAPTSRITLLTELLTKQNYDPNMRVAVDTRIHIFLPYNSFHPPRTALSWAAERNQTAAIDILISHGAIITPPIYMSPDNNGANTETSVLIRAIHEGHIEAVTTLLAHGANPKHPQRSPIDCHHQPADPTDSLPKSNLLIHALYSGNVDTLRILLDHPNGTELVMHSIPAENQIGAKPTPLFYVALYGGEGVFRLLLDRGLPIGDAGIVPIGRTPIRKSPFELTTPEYLFVHIAAQCLTLAAHGGIRLVRLLLDMGVNVHADFIAGYLVNLAATLEEDPEELLDFLLARGCVTSQPTLYIYMRVEFQEVSWDSGLLLLAQRVNLWNASQMGGTRTAFYLAAYNGDKNVMRRLLERGADPLVVWQGDVALSVVAKFQDAGAVEVVLRAFDERGLSLGEVEGALKQAQEYALADDRANIARVLHRFYWRRRYPLSP